MHLSLNSNDLYDLDLLYFQNFGRKLEKLFGKVDNVKLIICNSHEELKKCAAQQLGDLPEWVVGLSKENCICLRSPKNIKEKQMNFENVLKHELVHIFVNKFSNNCPPWLNEGIAQNLSEEEFDREKFADIKLINPYDISYESGLYIFSKLIVGDLFEIYGIPSVINRLKNCENFREDNIFGYCAIEKLIKRF